MSWKIALRIHDHQGWFGKRRVVDFPLFFFLLFFFSCSPAENVLQDEGGIGSKSLPVVDSARQRRIDSLYQSGEYAAVLPLVLRQLDATNNQQEMAELMLQAGICYYRLDSARHALKFLSSLIKIQPDHPLRDHLEMMLADCSIMIGDSSMAQKIYGHVLEFSSSSMVKSQASWKLARMVSDPEESLHYLEAINTTYLGSEVYEYMMFRLSLLEKTDRRAYREYLLKLLGKDFPRTMSDSLKKILLRNWDQLTVAQKIQVLDQFRLNGDETAFAKVDSLLQMESSLDRTSSGKIELIRGLNFYQQKRYQTALEKLQKLNDKDLSEEDRAEKYLHIARCYSRMGFTNDAIKAYYRFQQKFPRHPLAADALWWIALTYEQREDFRNSTKYYQKIQQHYPREKTDAAFRLVFLKILNKEYRAALKELDRMSRNLDYDQTFRMLYWKRKILLLSGKSEEAEKIREKLLVDPFQNYYTLRTFLETYKDSLSVFLQQYGSNSAIDRADPPEEMERIFLVWKHFGRQTAKYEIRDIHRKKIRKEGEVLYLAQYHEKLGNYDLAYGLLRDYYYSHYLNESWKKKMHFVRLLYPLYYDEIIYPMAEKYGIHHLLVLALMKRESLFQEQVKSYANAYGLMQILPSTASRLAKMMKFTNYQEPIDLYRPEINIPLGIFYLSVLAEEHDHHLPSVIASYNAGESRISNWKKRYPTDDDDLFIELMPIEQTRNYVKYVLYYYYNYLWFYDSSRLVAFLGTKPYSY